ncbi:MAG: lipoprotein [Alphaproteobacteria bacterium]|nr:lipoprotein [Alphaproteobacteria bacterium]
MHLKAWILLTLVVLAACGKKGPLEAPPGGTEDARVEREWNKDREKQ